MIIHESPEIDAFWKTACAALEVSENARHYVLPFAEYENETDKGRIDLIDGIGELAVKILKRGTCHQAMQFEMDNIPLMEFAQE